MKIPTLGLPLPLTLALPLVLAPAAAAGELIPELVPADTASNTERCFVVAAATREINFL